MSTLMFRCSPVSLSYTVLRYLSILFVTVILQVRGQCPQDIMLQAYGCFTSYSAELQNMYSSRYKLCCGVDVEVLRAFCSSYIQAMACIRDLKLKCPVEKHVEINRSMINLQGAERELAELCYDDNLYEKYAIHQTCFANEGFLTEHCFERFLNSTLRILTRVYYNSMYELCSNMKKIMDCVKPNILMKCGPAAEDLVEKLIKPMIRRSSECDNDIFHEIPPTQRLLQLSTSKPTMPIYSVKRHRQIITDETALGSSDSYPITYSFHILLLSALVSVLNSTR